MNIWRVHTVSSTGRPISCLWRGRQSPRRAPRWCSCTEPQQLRHIAVSGVVKGILVPKRRAGRVVRKTPRMRMVSISRRSRRARAKNLAASNRQRPWAGQSGKMETAGGTTVLPCLTCQGFSIKRGGSTPCRCERSFRVAEGQEGKRERQAPAARVLQLELTLGFARAFSHLR